MKKFLFFLTVIMAMIGIQSCGNEEEQFRLIELETTGVSLKLQNNAVSLYGEIPSAENELTFVATGENANLGFLSDFQIGNEFYYFNKEEYESSNQSVAVSGEWGHIELIKPDPYTTKVIISENKTSSDREFILRFGSVYTTALVTIIQKGAVVDNPKDDVKWDNIVCNQLSANEIFIGSQYLGIQNWDCAGNPPRIYPSAVFPETTFAKSFDKEIMYEKNPISVYTDFSNPFISTINNPSGVNYQQFLKKLLDSEEYASNKHPRLHLFRMCDIGTYKNIATVFKDNRALANTLQDIIHQKIKTEDLKNWIVGEIVFRGFSVTMDSPGMSGLFKDSNIKTKGMVYVKSMTYGATAYFIIGSNLSYDELKNVISSSSLFEDASTRLSKSSIILISNSSQGQNATLSTSFEVLNTFMREPYSTGDYGYPIYCTGCYVDDNSFVHVNTDY
ncbi:MAG: hypothetical protein Q4C34_02660 [Bacteroidales bacterium]|nr:hypothetical protein [Bacteroidales bacterium]